MEDRELEALLEDLESDLDFRQLAEQILGRMTGRRPVVSGN